MKAHPLAFLLFSALCPLQGASVTDRVDRLETQVSELQLLLTQINKRGSFERSSPRQYSGNSGSYVVRSGDSFWAIARRLNISVSSLQNANPGINPRRLGVGKTLRVPGGSSMASTPSHNSGSRSGMGTYKVKDGDILGRISENHGIRLHELMSANPGLDPRRLRIGKILNIPGQQRATISSPPPRKEVKKSPFVPEVRKTQPMQGLEPRPNPYLPKSQQTQRSITRKLYDVKPAEPRLVPVSRDSRLEEIAKLHQTTVAQINKLNDVELSPEQMIRSGSQLYVPSR